MINGVKNEKTIEFSIPEKKYKNLKEAFKEAGIFVVKISTDFVTGIVKNHLGNGPEAQLNFPECDLLDKMINKP
ncbi:MAG TPA: hypothetical protein VFV86_03995 [Nitrososphaeraceae archaeon]|nr:hypothetical protein [Nitrososphaeraceae archaeon]